MKAGLYLLKEKQLMVRFILELKTSKRTHTFLIQIEKISENFLETLTLMLLLIKGIIRYEKETYCFIRHFDILINIVSLS